MKYVLDTLCGQVGHRRRVVVERARQHLAVRVAHLRVRAVAQGREPDAQRLRVDAPDDLRDLGPELLVDLVEQEARECAICREPRERESQRGERDEPEREPGAQRHAQSPSGWRSV
ncbi:MAG: hypothetical protein KatS3mg010_0253 [Acidimicrobiia bacterium]|nr:MAG: hypothetical protein KatS3mg010_0253 [Acidimicrobiia bacterium]